MKKQLILFTIIASALAGGVTAGVIVSFNEKHSSGTYTTTRDGGGDYLFAGNTVKENILPDFTEAAERGVKSVVNIDIIKRVAYRGGSMGGDMDMFEYLFGNPQRGGQNQQPQFREQKGGGSGVIISEDGYIISNNHVIDEADEIKVTTSNGDYYTAKVIGSDPATDIALLKIDAKNLPVLEFGNSDNLRLGEWVLAIGNPYGLTSTVTQGIISAKGRAVGMSENSIESFIQTDAVVNAGNSGGALITLDGKLIGINTMIYSRTGSYAGYSFAVPSSIVRKVVADIREFGVVQRAMIGIRMGEITAEWLQSEEGKKSGIKERGGLYIAEVIEGGSAEAAGIKVGDIIISINDQNINKSAELQELIGKYRPNDKVKISVKRDGVLKHFEVTLRNKAGNTDIVTKPNFDLVKELGAQFREISEKQKTELKVKSGIQVLSLKPDGLLARSRVKAGFIITSINDLPIKGLNQLEAMDVVGVETIEGIYPDGVRMTYVAIPKK